MKQSSTSTRGRKKTAGAKAAGTRGAAATQHRTGARSNGTSSRSASSDQRGASSDHRSASSDHRSASSDHRSASSDQRGASSQHRGASADHRGAASGSRSNANERSAPRENTRTGGSHQEHFNGESHLEKFFLDQLQDIYYAEQKILQSLPRMAEATTTGELREAFEDHLHQTQRHVKRLEKAFESIGRRAEGKRCEAIEGIAREVENIIDQTEDGTLTRDAALIIAAQKVEHYEIATYGGLVQLAITMDLHDAADLLDKTLVEEEDTDARLTEIAENDINLRAEHEDMQSSWNAGEEEEEQGEDEENENEEAENPSM